MLSEIEDHRATRLLPSNRNDPHIHDYLVLLYFVLGLQWTPSHILQQAVDVRSQGRTQDFLKGGGGGAKFFPMYSGQ